MADAHQHEDRSTYYLDQLFTIGVCGAIAAVTILLWQSNLLGKMLHPKFHIWVAIGGVSLLVLVFLRAVAVWRSIDEATAGPKPDTCPPEEHGHSHGHSHSHGETHVQPAPPGGGSMGLALAPHADHGHDHGHSHSPSHTHSHSHSHAHGDGHDHGWAPWRYVVLLLPVVLYFLVLYNPAYDKEPVSSPATPLDYILNFLIIFRSILWEALPFIVLGAVIAGILEEFLPQSVMVSLVPRNPFIAVCVGGLLGLIFPMCECGIIPIMRRLLRKGLPLSSCIAYLLAGPIVNVVVLLSTIAAFSGMENVFEGSDPSYQMGSLHMTLFRAGLGYVVAVVTAMVVHVQYQKYGNDLLTPLARPENQPVTEEAAIASRPLWQRISNVTETALHDFIDITVFLILGALLAASVRMFLTTDQVADLGRQHALLAIAAMMGLAIVLCLCSEADAFVAASFVTLRPSAKLAFLVLGPMLDFKLYAMYTRIFRPRLILTIYACVIAQVFLYTTAVHYFWEAYSPDLISPKLTTTPNISEKEMREGLGRTASSMGLAAVPTPGGNGWGHFATAWGVLTVNTSMDAQDVSFLELENAARTPEMRNFFTGRRIRLTGRFLGDEKAFQLQRYKINCCAADATPLDAVIYVDQSAKESIPAARLRGKWVQVIGRVGFMPPPPGSSTWKVAILVSPTKQEPLGELVKEVPQDPNPYIY